MLKFIDLLSKSRGDKKIPKVLLCLDPGETTGWCVFNNGVLGEYGQIRTVVDKEVYWTELDTLFLRVEPDYVVCEDYRIYGHKLARHTFSPVLTLRLIGAIDYISYISKIPITYQMAVTAKGFVTDDKLKQWDFWQEGMKHARDAIRHGAYLLLFHKRGNDIK